MHAASEAAFTLLVVRRTSGLYNQLQAIQLHHYHSKQRRNC